MLSKRIRTFFGVFINDLNALKPVAFSVVGVLFFQMIFVLWVIYMEFANIEMIVNSVSEKLSAAMGSGEKFEISIELLQPLLVITIPISMCMMLVKLFGAYSKKESSDFMHSLPVSRTELFLSHFLSSIILSVVVYLVMNFFVSRVFMLFTDDDFSVSTANTGKVLVFSLVVGLMIGGAVVFARVLTSGGMAGVLTTFFILLFPRTLMIFIKSFIRKKVPYLVVNFGIFNDSNRNLLLGLFPRIRDNPANGFFGTEEDTIYSLIIALVYIAFAFLLFVVRKDEMIDNYVNSRRGLFILSFIKGLKYSLLPIGLLTALVLAINSNVNTDVNESIRKSLGTDANSIIVICVSSYLIGTVLYFKEQIKKLPVYKNLTTVLLGFLLLILVNSGFILGVNHYVQSQKNRLQSIDDVEYIELCNVSWKGIENELYSRLNNEILEGDFDREFIYSIISSEHKNLEMYSKVAFDNYPIMKIQTTSGKITRYLLMDKWDMLLSLQNFSYGKTYFIKDKLPSPDSIVKEETELVNIEWYEIYYEEIMASDKEYYELITDQINEYMLEGLTDANDIKEVYLEFEVDGKKASWGFPVISALEKSYAIYTSDIEVNKKIDLSLLIPILMGAMNR